MLRLDEKNGVLSLSGEWRIGTAGRLEPLAERLARERVTCIDVSGISRIDTAGMILVRRICARTGCDAIAGQSGTFRRLLQFSVALDTPVAAESAAVAVRPAAPWREWGTGAVLFLSFLGETVLQGLRTAIRPGFWRLAETAKQVEQSGARALGIVGLSAFLIGIVIAYQVGVQIEKVGANIFIVDMIAISSMRELVPLVVAIVVAGRSGSAYTAQIGVMKVTEELDAMRTLGFEPFRFLVLPRVVGLALAMPLLVFFADMVAMAGGAVVAKMQLGLSYHAFIGRFYEAFAMKHFYIGLVKAPFFALIIALIGCYRGFQVTADSQSIGAFTTRSVVDAIFAVICCDALFSIIFTRMGI